MSLTEIHRDDPTAAARPSYRRDALLALSLVLTVAVLLAVAVARSSLERPDAFTPGGSSAEAIGPHAASAAWTGVMTYGPVDAVDPGVAPRTVDVVSIVPRIEQNSAHADVRLVLCPSGSLAPTGQEPCAGAATFTGGQVALGLAPGRQLFVVATSHGPGTLVVDGYDVTYRDGLRSGTQHVGGTFTLTSTS